jgi:hypothetical protein
MFKNNFLFLGKKNEEIKKREKERLNIICVEPLTK